MKASEMIINLCEQIHEFGDQEVFIYRAAECEPRFYTEFNIEYDDAVESEYIPSDAEEGIYIAIM